MTSPAPMPGPPCDICGEAPAVLSILNYADWQQLKLCGADAPAVMRGIADTMDGGQPAEPEPVTATVTGPPPETLPPDRTSGPGAADSPGGGTAEGITAGDALARLNARQGDDEPGSARDHWASTTSVRRSTHGHRTPRKAAGTPRKDEPE